MAKTITPKVSAKVSKTIAKTKVNSTTQDGRGSFSQLGNQVRVSSQAIRTAPEKIVTLTIAPNKPAKPKDLEKFNIQLKCFTETLTFHATRELQAESGDASQTTAVNWRKDMEKTGHVVNVGNARARSYVLAFLLTLEGLGAVLVNRHGKAAVKAWAAKL